jgi:hypothetical protein
MFDHGKRGMTRRGGAAAILACCLASAVGNASAPSGLGNSGKGGTGGRVAGGSARFEVLAGFAIPRPGGERRGVDSLERGYRRSEVDLVVRVMNRSKMDMGWGQGVAVLWMSALIAPFDPQYYDTAGVFQQEPGTLIPELEDARALGLQGMLVGEKQVVVFKRLPVAKAIEAVAGHARKMWLWGVRADVYVVDRRMAILGHGSAILWIPRN